MGGNTTLGAVKRDEVKTLPALSLLSMQFPFFFCAAGGDSLLPPFQGKGPGWGWVSAWGGGWASWVGAACTHPYPGLPLEGEGGFGGQECSPGISATALPKPDVVTFVTDRKVLISLMS